MKFLKQVADYFISNPQRRDLLGSYVFVLPNKRSALYMSKYLKDMMPEVGFMPKFATITSFTQDFCSRSLAQPIEQLFILYNCYCKVLKSKGVAADEIRDFDSFIFWGNVALKDFSDVDAYMADPKELFRNLKGLKEIESSYLTPEQIQVAKILGDKRDYTDYLKNFWNHMPTDPQKKSVNKFIRLWEMMFELYNEFNAAMLCKNLAYTGLQAKEAYLEMKEMGVEDFASQRFAFIGFYVLSTARAMMFGRLRDLGIADFFWDTASPMLRRTGCHAGDFILPLAKTFPAPEDFELEEIKEMPEANIYPVASNVGQTKVAAHILKEWNEGQAQQIETAVKDNEIAPMPTTGIILPSEKLLDPMMQSIPPTYFPINVAMKASLSSTAFAGLFSSILTMQEHVRQFGGGNQFFYREVLDVLSNPYIMKFDAVEAAKLRDEIQAKHLYNICSEDVCKNFPGLKAIFATPGPKARLAAAQRYVLELIDALQKTPDVDTEVLSAYVDVVNTLMGLAAEYKIDMKEHAYFRLIRKILQAYDIQFSGSPIWGVQVMGIPDSRVLDFDNLVVLSLNERIFPKRNPAISLIPESLRYAYGLPTADNEEVNNSYLFYRMISRAKNLALTYDDRSSDMARGEISRYLLQLIDAFQPEGKVKIHDTAFGMDVEDNRVITIEKTPEVMADVDRLRAGGDLKFSASSLKTYLKCPLQFYLREVKKLNYDNNDPQYMDAASYGQIVHKVAEVFYTVLSKNKGKEDPWIKPEELAAEVANPALEDRLKDYALEAMNELYYNHRYDRRLSDIPGEGRVLARVIAKYVKEMLRSESRGREFKFVAAEFRGFNDVRVHPWKINDDLTINFTMSIDRIDELRSPDGKLLRFIDYKTGTDELKAPKFDLIFTEHKYHAIFQLLLYSLAYNEIMEPGCGILPMIYLFKDIVNGIEPIKIEKKELMDYHKFDVGGEPLPEAFRQRLEKTLSDIFNPEIPFTQTENHDNCKFCLFAQLCGRLADTQDD